MNPVEAAEINLRWLLRDVEPLLSDPALTDLHINAPGVAFVDRGSGMERIELPFTFRDLEDIAICAAALTRQDIAEDVPLVSTRFPGGHRVQIVRPPAVADGQFAFSIRRPKAQTGTLEDLERGGSFARTVGTRRMTARTHERLLALHSAGRWGDFLAAAVETRLNVVFSGMVGSGKTHAMRAAIHAAPLNWRLVTIEDMPELIGLPHGNVVNLFYSKGGQSVATTTPESLVETALRMGVDGLLMQELRDEAAHAYLNALKSGHWGMTTTHADSAGDVFERIAGLVKQHHAGKHLVEADLLATLRRNVHVVVHCVRDGDERYVEQVLYQPPQDVQQPARHEISHIPSSIAAE